MGIKSKICHGSRGVGGDNRGRRGAGGGFSEEVEGARILVGKGVKVPWLRGNGGTVSDGLALGWKDLLTANLAQQKRKMWPYP